MYQAWLNSTLQSNCLGLDWAPAQPSLFPFSLLKTLQFDVSKNRFYDVRILHCFLFILLCIWNLIIIKKHKNIFYYSLKGYYFSEKKKENLQEKNTIRKQAGAELGQAQLQLELRFTLIKVCCITLWITSYISWPQ